MFEDSKVLETRYTLEKVKNVPKMFIESKYLHIYKRWILVI